MPVQNRIQVRRGTAGAGSYQWTTQVLYAGEIGYETDTGKFKIGDGSTIWSSLPYAAVLPSDLTESVQDIIGTSIVGSGGVEISYSDSTGNTTISLSNPTVQASGITGLDESIDDRVSNLLVAGSGIQLTYNDNANSLTVAATGLSLSGHTHTASNITDFVDSVNDRVANLLTAGSNIQLSYTDNGNNTSSLSIGVSGVSLSGHTHTVSNITDFNTAVSELLPVKNITAGSGISVSSSSGNFTVALSDPSIQVADITDLTASASELNYLDLTGSPGTAEASKAVVLDSNKDFTGLRNLTLSGNLTVNGTTTTINSTTVNVDDKNLELGSIDSPTDTTADGGGITLKGASDKEFKWVNSTTSWTSSENINLNSSSLTYKLNGTTVIGNNILGASGYSLASGIVIDGGTP
jgi:hypothetical protein